MIQNIYGDVPAKDIFDDRADLINEIHQCWAEAIYIFEHEDVTLVLPDELKDVVKETQNAHLEQDINAGLIDEYLTNISKNDRTCVADCFINALKGSRLHKLSPRESKEIARNINALPDWKPIGTRNFKPYGKQKVWQRITPRKASGHDLSDYEEGNNIASTGRNIDADTANTSELTVTAAER